jgi:hypothetical protein
MRKAIASSKKNIKGLFIFYNAKVPSPPVAMAIAVHSLPLGG